AQPRFRSVLFSALYLAHCLIHLNFDRERLARAAPAHAAYRRRAEKVEPDGDAHVGIGGANPIRHIEGDPAEPEHEGFGPGVSGLLRARGIIAAKIPADVADRNVQTARGRDKDLREILTYAALD